MSLIPDTHPLEFMSKKESNECRAGTPRPLPPRLPPPPPVRPIPEMNQTYKPTMVTIEKELLFDIKLDLEKLIAYISLCQDEHTGGLNIPSIKWQAWVDKMDADQKIARKQLHDINQILGV